MNLSILLGASIIANSIMSIDNSRSYSTVEKTRKVAKVEKKQEEKISTRTSRNFGGFTF